MMDGKEAIFGTHESILGHVRFITRAQRIPRDRVKQRFKYLEEISKKAKELFGDGYEKDVVLAGPEDMKQLFAEYYAHNAKLINTKFGGYAGLYEAREKMNR